eukprot:Clim_evm234s157 gene=Clim_evmTU234s157
MSSANENSEGSTLDHSIRRIARSYGLTGNSVRSILREIVSTTTLQDLITKVDTTGNRGQQPETNLGSADDAAQSNIWNLFTEDDEEHDEDWLPSDGQLIDSNTDSPFDKILRGRQNSGVGEDTYHQEEDGGAGGSTLWQEFLDKLIAGEEFPEEDEDDGEYKVREDYQSQQNKISGGKATSEPGLQVAITTRSSPEYAFKERFVPQLYILIQRYVQVVVQTLILSRGDASLKQIHAECGAMLDRFVSTLSNQQTVLGKRKHSVMDVLPLHSLPLVEKWSKGKVMAWTSFGKHIPKTRIMNNKDQLHKAGLSESAILDPRIVRIFQECLDFFEPEITPLRHLETAENQKSSQKKKRLKFVSAEDELFAEGIRLFGHDYKMIAQYILPPKIEKQLRFRYKNVTSREKGKDRNPLSVIAKNSEAPLSAFEIELLEQGFVVEEGDFKKIQANYLPFREAEFIEKKFKRLDKSKLFQFYENQMTLRSGHALQNREADREDIAYPNVLRKDLAEALLELKKDDGVAFNGLLDRRPGEDSDYFGEQPGHHIHSTETADKQEFIEEEEELLDHSIAEELSTAQNHRMTVSSDFLSYSTAIHHNIGHHQSNGVSALHSHMSQGLEHAEEEEEI